MTIKQFERFVGYFSPKNGKTLKVETVPFIGRKLVWEPLWIIEDGPYKGQWALRALAKNGDWLPFGWCPEEDIVMSGVDANFGTDQKSPACYV